MISVNNSLSARATAFFSTYFIYFLLSGWGEESVGFFALLEGQGFFYRGLHNGS